MGVIAKLRKKNEFLHFDDPSTGDDLTSKSMYEKKLSGIIEMKLK